MGRDRLRHQEELAAAVGLGAEALVPDPDPARPGAAELLARAASELEGAAARDTGLRGAAERLAALHYEAADVGAELRAYLLAIEQSDFSGPGGAARLEEVEERLALLAALERKHGGTVTDVLAHAERCRSRRDELRGADSALEQVDSELARSAAGRERLAGRLTAARRRAAPRLAAAVRGRLRELAMADARFAVELSPREGGCGPRGADVVEMQIAPNAGGSLRPLREVASGGELSRVMLALLSVAHGRPPAAGEARPLLVFDEVDAGIGGHTARAVGEHLRALAAGRQVVCITHLPQVAALADRHFTIAKDAGTAPATTTVTALTGDAVVGELVRMLGAGEQDAAATEHARELLRAADERAHELARAA